MDQITRQIVELREQGHSIRAIAKELDIPKSTVHKWLRDAMHVEDAMVFSSTHADGALLVHFPFNFVCPGCGKEQNHAYFCRGCGKFIPAECEGSGSCVEGFDLSEVEIG